MQEGIVKTPARGLKSKEAAVCWEEALVTGNGKMGALVFGDPLEETIILNHEKLYEPFNDHIVQNNDLSPYLKKIRAMMKKGKFQDAADLFSNKSGHPLLFTDAYHPAYALKLDLAKEGYVTDYMRTVDFETGEVAVQWEDNRGEMVRKQFISRTHDVMVLQLKSNQNALLNGELYVDDLVLEGSAKDKKVSTDDVFISFTCNYLKTKKGYGGTSLILTKGGGSVITENEKILIRDTREVIILTKVTPIDDYERDVRDTLASLKEELLSIANKDYQTLKSAHVKEHGEMFRRMTFSICEDTEMDITTEELLAEPKEELNQRLLQKMFDMGRYVFISASGDNPPNLVGLWTGDWRPPWSGDFTTDANVNLAVSGGGIGNMREALEGYFKLIEKISPDWKVNAKTLYGCRGFLAGARTDGNHNIHTHFNKDWPLGFWTAAAQWLVMPFFEWYQISGDREFFIHRTLPLMKEIALFYEDFLTEYDENGKVMFVPSYSPENTPIIENELLAKGWQESQAAINATMDIAATKELLTNLISTCTELDIEKDNVQKWREQLEQLPDYMINEDGALKEWSHKDLHDKYDHRHISHLYPVWPGHEITPSENPRLFKAAEIALQKRKRGNDSAHGVMHCGIVAARQKNSRIVLENMKFLLEEGDYIHSSLVTSHNPGREVYNVDANCSLPTLVMEMLVYTYPGVVELLPALPEEIARGSITGILGRGQVKVENLEWDLLNKKVSISLLSGKDQEIELCLRQGISKVIDSENTIVRRVNNYTILLNLKSKKLTKLQITI
ncbi:alpha-L-fucosidase [Salipaludibacillus neizhouensis]|uniref:Alpha-L-fucosidase n=1 Tax=Salipaludibacillus neizhouensis TaxID=885475 RepID=A0A3A9K365_9BACI|nr:glycoside hydrolase N-terminal domain-containing protein [Salipaludibacillus neizhouensis]RKL67117.1 alpha-L-fucosidase [Salipaludibacillus neizhouensis]